MTLSEVDMEWLDTPTKFTEGDTVTNVFTQQQDEIHMLKQYIKLLLIELNPEVTI